MTPHTKSIALVAILTGFLVIEPTKAENVRFSIGVIAPLSGDFASAGENIRQGITLSQEDLRSDGIDVSVHFEDACLPAAGVSSFKKLVQRDKVNAIVSNYCIVTLAAIVDTLEREKIPTLQNSVFPENLFSNRKYLFSTWPSIHAEVKQGIDSLKAQGKLSKVGVMYLETPWGTGYADSLKQLISSGGGEIVRWEGNPIGVNDFRTELTKIRAANPSAIFVAHTGTMLSNLLKQARALGLEVPIFVPSDADDEQIVAAAGESAEGVSLFATDSPEPTQKMKEFASVFKARYGVAPNPFARHAYDQLHLMAEALHKCKGDPECTSGELRNRGAIDGISGAFKFSADGGAERKFYRRIVQNGHFVFAEDRRAN